MDTTTSRFRLRAPNGALIKGTYEQIFGTALASTFTVDEAGELVPEHEDYTEVHWDSQETLARENGEIRLICFQGEEWTASECTREPVE